MSFALEQLLSNMPLDTASRFREEMRSRRFLRHERLLGEGQTERFLSIVEEGIVRAFFRRGDREFTTDFIFPGQFACAYDSFITRNPSELQLEALTDGRLSALSYDSLQRLYSENGHSQIVGRKAAENLYLQKAQRERSLLADTPEERYRRLLEAHPEYIQLIPLRYLASWLGVSPETLSRIRARIS